MIVRTIVNGKLKYLRMKRSEVIKEGTKTSENGITNDHRYNIWSSPDVEKMTEMSTDWYRKVLTDSVEIHSNHQHERAFDVRYQQYNSPLLSPTKIPYPFFNEEAIDSVDEFGIQFDSSNFSNLFENYDDFLTPEDSSVRESSISSPVKQPFTNMDMSVRLIPKYRKANFEKITQISGRIGRGRRGQNNSNLLANCCHEVLAITAHPTLEHIGEIIAQLQSHHPCQSEKQLRSLVREWFRKRREYMATKIYRSCDRLLPKMSNTLDENLMNEFIKEIIARKDLVKVIKIEARLPMESDDEKMDFVREKIADFYMKYPQRKLRNCRGFD